jgi:hypothetical protein
MSSNLPFFINSIETVKKNETTLINYMLMHDVREIEGQGYVVKLKRQKLPFKIHEISDFLKAMCEKQPHFQQLSDQFLQLLYNLPEERTVGMITITQAFTDMYDKDENPYYQDFAQQCSSGLSLIQQRKPCLAILKRNL